MVFTKVVEVFYSLGTYLLYRNYIVVGFTSFSSGGFSIIATVANPLNGKPGELNHFPFH